MKRCFPSQVGARYLAGALTCVALTLASGEAVARDPDRVEWSQDWPRFRAAELALTGGMALQAAAALFVYPEPRQRWEGGILFDEAARTALRLEGRGARDGAATWSDNIYYLLAAYPLLVDTAIVTAGVHGSGDVAVQMLAMNLEGYAFSGAIALGAEKVGRARPLARECRENAEYSEKCGSEADLNASFLSGHTAIAFTSAGLVCAHHQHLPLYGGGAPDLVACVTALSAATTAGTLRVMSDNHYSTDVVLATGVGLFGGYVMPSLLHYGFTSGRSPRRASLLPTFAGRSGGFEWSAVLAPELDSSRLGVRLAGTF